MSAMCTNRNGRRKFMAKEFILNTLLNLLRALAPQPARYIATDSSNPPTKHWRSQRIKIRAGFAVALGE